MGEALPMYVNPTYTATLTTLTKEDIIDIYKPALFSIGIRGPSWSCSYSIWINNYLCKKIIAYHTRYNIM